ncbi:hypothetical protein [Rubrivirga marina]|uniref:Right handed beta helix domain-containing protein n=1 Tax=Rubrivirga marina TaxID=1196024 RepID=A0A271J586_9BACT|nr:hypothetical protein [Rubrivirga marina]PAP78234.1 hypothetical protein BSZ37_18280 [Rubrivirga marina]
MRLVLLAIAFAATGCSAADALNVVLDPTARPVSSASDDSPSNGASQADVIILVAQRGTPAYAFAESRENGSTIFAERKLWRGLQKAAEILNEGGSRTVTVGVAGGEYDGEFGGGIQRVPRIDNPEGTLKLLAGFNDDFSGRQPFAFAVSVPTIRGRDGAIFQIASRTTLKELVISGLILDAAPSNKYDARTNSLVKGESRNYPLMSWAQMEAERVVIADNIFLNGASGTVRLGMTPPRGVSGEVIVQNNFFLNNLLAFETQTYGRRIGAPYGRLVVRNNSFLANFPYNPDPTSSNVSAVELHTSESFQETVFERNLFAYNAGGAFQVDWPQDRLADFTLRENLFFLNGVLWGEGAAEAAVFAGKFGTGAVYRILDLYDVEDDVDGEVSGNVAFDPQVPIVMAPLQSVDGASVSAQPTLMNDVRRLFGANTDGGTVAIANFAPQMMFDIRAVPLPQNEEAKAFGVQPAIIYGATGAPQ